MINKGVFSSIAHNWETPVFFIKLIEKKFNVHFDLDVCATKKNAKCKKFFTPEDNALTKDWNAKVCYMNPPYGRSLPIWLEYAKKQSEKHNNQIFCLVPARTDTNWFHDIAIFGEIYLLKGRINFEIEGKKLGSPAFPSMIVIFGRKRGIYTWDWKKEL